MADWPFSRANPGGWVDNDVPTHTQLNKIDDQVAQAADGLLWTDAALAKNWLYESGALANRGVVAVWSGNQWVSVGRNGTTPECSVSLEGKSWASVGSMGAGVGFSAVMCAASNGAGRVVVGGVPSSSSDLKLRESSDHGITWNVRNTAATGTVGVTALGWFAAAGLFVAVLSNGTIETSPDGITWTARIVPTPSSAGGIAISPTAVVAIIDTNQVGRSTDGINWTSINIPLPGGGSQYELLTYSPGLRRFFAFGNGGAGPFQLAISDDDGLTWTTPVLTEVTNIQSVTAYGRMLVATATTPNRVVYSVDGAVSWRRAKLVANLVQDGAGVVLGRSQLLFADDSQIHYGSIALGL